MPAINWGAPARPRSNGRFVTLLAVLLALLLAPAAGLARDAHRTWERAAWNLRTWYAARSLPGPGREAGHFRVWLLGADAGEMTADPVTPPAALAGVDAAGREAGEEMPRQLVEQLEAAYSRLTDDLGVEPPGPVLLALYRDRCGLDRRAGGAAGTTTGVYAAGVIHLLWQGDLRGPLVHEMTHYLLDLVAPGRVPRWFQEGLAQLEEYRLTGKVLYDPALVPPVPWVRLDREFNRLPDEVAYGASLSLVLFLYHEGGDGALRQMVGALSRGVPFERAVRLCWGRSLAELDARRLGEAVPPVGVK